VISETTGGYQQHGQRHGVLLGRGFGQSRRLVRLSQNGVALAERGGNIVGSNTSTLVLSEIQLANVTVGNSAGTFTVIVTNALGSTSASANLSVGQAPAS